MKKIFCLVWGVLGLAACATQPTAARYEDELSAWLGQSEEALYAEWGYPNATYSIGADGFIATYIQVYNEPVGADTEPYADEMSYSAMRVPSYGLPVAQGVYYCKTSFIIRNGIVTDYNFNGDDCVR
ncbi:MAG: hypothetical protein Q4D80_06055 [Pseudomonadota bacterium]|nr:hypothetical protein [Pseudomonadota bacterium]